MDARERLLAGLPATEQRLRLAGIPTSVLAGGDGTPVVLLHGPGEFAAHWLRVISPLTRTHLVVAPDLPGHGASGAGDAPLDPEQVLGWLGELIERTCPTPPVLVGRVLGGAIAARFAGRHRDRLAHLVLVDTLGLTPLRLAPRFELAVQRFMAAPNEHSYDRLMGLCSFDLDTLVEQLGEQWEPFAAYAIDRARTPAVQACFGSLMAQFGTQPIPPAELSRIAVPTALIWGRHDMATPLRVAEEAGARYGWPLHVIEDAADDPPIEQPEAFLRALHGALKTPAAQETAR
jgi:pimeloyl-ACP methyl ester carboxylesterase